MSQRAQAQADIFRANGIKITVDVSAGEDNAFVIFIDTPTFEPDGSDGKGGLRVMLNDEDIYVGQPYIPIDD